MVLKNLFKNKEAILPREQDKTIEVEINSKDWKEAAFGLRGKDEPGVDSQLFKKLGFKIGDKIKVFSINVPEEISKKISQWTQGGKNLPKRFFRIISSERGEFILATCYYSAILLNNDLTEEKKYEFTFSDLDSARLISEKNVICNLNVKLEITYSYNQLSIICKDIKTSGQSIRLKFSIGHEDFAYFDDAEITEANISRIKDETIEIRKQLLKLKEIPTNENNDGVIKLFDEISLSDFFGKKVVLEEIVLTTGNREDTIEFKDKKVSSYQIKDLVSGTKRQSSNEYGIISEPNYVIETSSKGVNIKLHEVSKKTYVNENNQYLLDVITTGIAEQKSMDELFTKVEKEASKSLKPRKSSK